MGDVVLEQQFDERRVDADQALDSTEHERQVKLPLEKRAASEEEPVHYQTHDDHDLEIKLLDTERPID